MTLAPGEFIRRFLLYVLPKGFHCIRHYGLLASASCKANIVRARQLIAVPVLPDPRAEDGNTDQAAAARRCSSGLVRSARRPLTSRSGNPWENGFIESLNARLRDETTYT